MQEIVEISEWKRRRRRRSFLYSSKYISIDLRTSSKLLHLVHKKLTLHSCWRRAALIPLQEIREPGVRNHYQLKEDEEVEKALQEAAVSKKVTFQGHFLYLLLFSLARWYSVHHSIYMAPILFNCNWAALICAWRPTLTPTPLLPWLSTSET